LDEDGIFEDWQTARTESFSYIEFYYNRKRLHSGINYKTPMEKEEELKQLENRRISESKVSVKT
jgi:transposase